jgi:hypothetical protein
MHGILIHAKLKVSLGLFFFPEKRENFSLVNLLLPATAKVYGNIHTLPPLDLNL